MDYYPNCYFVLALVALAVINNLIMLAAPTFPGRAGFGSVVFIVIAAISLFSIPEVFRTLLSRYRKRVLAAIIGLIFIPMAFAVLHQHIILYAENNQRIACVESMVGQGMDEVVLEPSSVKNLVLRHVYFVDMNNGVSKYGFCRYYGLKDVIVRSKTSQLAAY